MYKIIFAVLFFFIETVILTAQPSDYELEEIQFEGNESLSSSELSGVISNQESPNWFLKFINSISDNFGSPTIYFDSLSLKSDRESLLDYYRDQGFFETRISSSFSLNDEEKEAVIRFVINEGPRFIINSATIRGLDNIPEEFRSSIFEDSDIDSGKYYTKTLIQENNSETASYLLNHGYMLVEPQRPEIIVDTASNFVNVIVGFNPGLRYRIGEIRVEKTGEAKNNIRDTLLKKLVGVKPGQYYSAEALNRGQVRLYRTNLFRSVLVNTVISDTQNNLVPLRIKADVSDLNELVPEILMNNQESTFNVGLAASYNRKNFLGDARNFTLSSNFTAQDVFNIDYSKLGRILAVTDTSILGLFDGRLSIEQPYFFGKPIRTIFEGYFTINKQTQYKSTIYGGRMGLDFELPRFVFFRSLQTYYSIERSKYRIVDDYLRALLRRRNISIDTLNIADPEPFTTSILGVETGINRADDLLFPTKGYTLTLNFEEANSIPALIDDIFNTELGSRAQFYRIMTGFNYYPRVYKSEENAFGLKFKMGYIQAFSGSEDDIPLNKRFTAGGSNSVRGWRARDLSPDPDIGSLSVSDIISLVEQNIPTIGGTFLFEGSVETRNRLAGPLGGALFLDFGNVWNSYKKFRYEELAVAVGFGIRFYSSFAPIRLDFGFKAYNPENKKTLFDKSKVLKELMEIHIGIGEAF